VRLFNYIFNVYSINKQSIADAYSLNFTHLPPLMSMARQVFVFLIGEDDKEERKKEMK
jgi:hypothetical protein